MMEIIIEMSINKVICRKFIVNVEKKLKRLE